MMTYRNCDRRFPFLWESADQPEARWNFAGGGPVQYLADTPDGAWAEFLRHEEIVEEVDFAGIARALWAVDADTENLDTPDLPEATMTGGASTYPTCQAEAQRLRDAGARGITAPSAALLPRTAGGYRIDTGFQPGPPRDGRVYVLFGTQPEATGWIIVDQGRPPLELLRRVQHI